MRRTTTHEPPPPKLTDTTVLRYLRQHPDLFVRHPEMLARLHIPHGSDRTVSLVEHQIAVLREQVQHERQRLHQLIGHAHAYERLQHQLHQITLQVVAARDVAHTCQMVDAALQREFHAEAVAIKLLPDTAPTAAPWHSLSAFVALGHCFCGTLETAQYLLLFDEAGTQLNSVALIPLRAQGVRGVLAIGSHDAERFTPDLATDVLARIGEMISAKLAEYLSDT